MKTTTLILASSVAQVLGFTSQHHNRASVSASSLPPIETSSVDSQVRRNVFSGAAFLTSFAIFQPSANAIPMISVDEFSIVLRDSALSIQQVEFSGPRGETVTVKLVDGTTFGIKDVVESPSDPRSPLKVAAACRESGVKTKFVELEAILANAPKRKKMYTNQRVQDAAEKEREKRERMRQDEEDRIRQLRQMEEAEEAASIKK